MQLNYLYFCLHFDFTLIRLLKRREIFVLLNKSCVFLIFYPHTYTHTHTHTDIYIYIYIYQFCKFAKIREKVKIKQRNELCLKAC